MRIWVASIFGSGLSTPWVGSPYIQMGVLSRIVGEIDARSGKYDQDDLEKTLAQLYEPIGLAAMVMHRYPIAPIIKDYNKTIAEARSTIISICGPTTARWRIFHHALYVKCREQIGREGQPHRLCDR
jgi:hypothetical protein